MQVIDIVERAIKKGKAGYGKLYCCDFLKNEFHCNECPFDIDNNEIGIPCIGLTDKQIYYLAHKWCIDELNEEE